MKLHCLFALFGAFVMLPASAARAESFAKVLYASGGATFAGQPLQTGQSLETAGVINTGHDGRAKIMLTSGTVIQLGVDSQLPVGPTPANQAPELHPDFGTMRWTVRNHSKDGKPVFVVHTKNAVMGVRGTDFYTNYNVLFDESEIIVFDGTVEMSALTNPSDKQMIGRGQWGGLGGRFGKKINGPTVLPAHVVETFNQATRVAPAASSAPPKSSGGSTAGDGE